MAEVASNQVSEGSRSQSDNHLAGPTPSFTAVNGTASPAPAPSTNARSEPEPPKEATEAPNHRSILPNNQQATHHSPYTHQDAPKYGQETVHQERRPEPINVPASSAPIPAPHALAPAPTQGSKPPTPAPVAIQPAERPASKPTQYPEISNSPRPQYPNGHSRDHGDHQQDQTAMSPHLQKRKRSFEGESEQRRPEYERPPPPQQPYQANGQPPSETGRAHEMENGSARERPNYSPRKSYPPPPVTYPPPPQEGYGAPIRMREAPDIYPRPERQHTAPDTYDQAVDPSITPVPPRQPYYADPQEAHLANALQRENRGYEGMAPKDQIQYGTPEDDDGGHDGYYANYRSSEDQERKRRKRVFSNRTKTGCMTCRRRKKKCDEMHPECKWTLPIQFRLQCQCH